MRRFLYVVFALKNKIKINFENFGNFEIGKFGLKFNYSE